MKTTMIAGALAIALAAPAYAELEGDLSLTYNSQYSFRGVNGILADAADQFGADTDNTFNAALNLNYALNDQWSVVAGANINSLSDTSVDHNSFRVGALYTADCYTIELGYQRHELSSILNNFIGSLDTSEIYLNVGAECPLTGGDLNLFVAHDLDELSGTYVELSLKKGWELSEVASVEVTVGVSYSFDYWDDIGGTGALNTGSDWNHAYISVGLPLKATDNLTVTPFVTYSEGFGALDPAPIGGVDLEEGGEFIYGLSASVKF